MDRVVRKAGASILRCEDFSFLDIHLISRRNSITESHKRLFEIISFFFFFATNELDNEIRLYFIRLNEGFRYFSRLSSNVNTQLLVAVFSRGFPSFPRSTSLSLHRPPCHEVFFPPRALSLASSWCNVPSRLVAGDNRSSFDTVQLPFLIIVPARSKMDSSNRGPWGSEGRGRTGGYHDSNKASRRLPATITSDSHPVPSWSLFESPQDAPLYQRIDFYNRCYFYRDFTSSAIFNTSLYFILLFLFFLF